MYKALLSLVQFPAVINALVHSSMFLPPNLSAATFEAETLLGPFFQLSPLQAKVTTGYFSSPKTMDKNIIVTTQNSLRMTLRTHQTDLLTIANAIIRNGKE